MVPPTQRDTYTRSVRVPAGAPRATLRAIADFTVARMAAAHDPYHRRGVVRCVVIHVPLIWRQALVRRLCGRN